jgi:hypothetical protein
MCQKLAASHYVLDFGHVVKGSAKVVRRFRIYNYSSKPVSFRFDRNVLEAYGLKVRLAPCVISLPALAVLCKNLKAQLCFIAWHGKSSRFW